MSISIIFSIVMPVLRYRLMRSEPFQPKVEILMESGFIIIDKNRGGYVHCVGKSQSLFYTALLKTILDLRSNINKCPARRDIEPKFFSIAFHFYDLNGRRAIQLSQAAGRF